MAITEDESEQLFKRLELEDISLFYIKTPVELGFVGTEVT